MGAAVIPLVTTALTTGVSVYQGNKQEKQIKNQAADADARNQKALADAKAAQALSASQAQQQIKNRKMAMAGSKTNMTGPLGIQEQATTAKKTLLGS